MRRTVIVLTGIVWLAGVALGATVASAEPVPCLGPLGAVTIQGDVAAGIGCDLSNTTVNGSVYVVPGGMLFVAPGTNTKIYGNLISQDAQLVQISSGWIGGDVKLVGTTGMNGAMLTGIRLEHAQVAGDVTIKHGAAFIEVLYMQVGGDVVLHDNNGSDPSGQYGFVVGVYASAVGGHVTLHDNAATGSFFNQVAVALTSIGRNLHVHSNRTLGGSAQNSILVYKNTVGENVMVNGNTASGPAGSASFVDVSGNTVTGSLSCRGNTPDATAFQTGVNSAARKRAECADL